MQRTSLPVIPGRSGAAAQGKGIHAPRVVQGALHEPPAWIPFPALTRRRG